MCGCGQPTAPELPQTPTQPNRDVPTVMVSQKDDTQGALPLGNVRPPPRAPGHASILVKLLLVLCRLGPSANPFSQIWRGRDISRPMGMAADAAISLPSNWKNWENDSVLPSLKRERSWRMFSVMFCQEGLHGHRVQYLPQVGSLLSGDKTSLFPVAPSTQYSFVR